MTVLFSQAIACQIAELSVPSQAALQKQITYANSPPLGNHFPVTGGKYTVQSFFCMIKVSSTLQLSRCPWAAGGPMNYIRETNKLCIIPETLSPLTCYKNTFPYSFLLFLMNFQSDCQPSLKTASKKIQETCFQKKKVQKSNMSCWHLETKCGIENMLKISYKYCAH